MTKSRLALYSSCIHLMNHHQASDQQEQAVINELVNTTKVLFENHEMSIQPLKEIIKKTAEKITAAAGKDLLNQIEHCVFQFDLSKEVEYKHDNHRALFENPQGRHFESHFAIQFLLHPTELMKQSAAKVSRTIIAIVEQMQARVESTDYLQEWLKDLSSYKVVINQKIYTVGGNENAGPFFFEGKATLELVVAVLKENKDFPKIMYIQLFFARHMYRSLPVEVLQKAHQSVHDAESKAEPDQLYRNKKLVAWCQAKIADTQVSIEDFLSSLAIKDRKDFINDYVGRYAVQDKGRGEENRYYLSFINTSKRLGLMLPEQDETDFPEYEAKCIKDSHFQLPDYHSQWVSRSLMHEVPFVSGASGMTDLLIATMELLCRPTEAEERAYLLCCIAYVVGSGLHSIHEVLIIGSHGLELIPNYRYLGDAIGNYGAFFALFDDDKEFRDNRNQAWNAYMKHYSQAYAAQQLTKTNLLKTQFFDANLNEEKKEEDQEDKLLIHLRRAISEGERISSREGVLSIRLFASPQKKAFLDEILTAKNMSDTLVVLTNYLKKYSDKLSSTILLENILKNSALVTYFGLENHHPDTPKSKENIILLLSSKIKPSTANEIRCCSII